MTEAELIDLLRHSATDPAARNLEDDVAVLDVGGSSLILTHDMIVEGVHYLSGDSPADVAWKLLAVNLSDLAAKGAAPVGVLLGFMLGDESWDRAFVEGFATALSAFGVPLLGGDTVSAQAGAVRSFGLTAIGRSEGAPPSRAGAEPGDLLWVTGTIGDAGAGLAILRGDLEGNGDLVERYRNPRPRLEAGQRISPLAKAMMDVSDGLLIDSSRMAGASGCSVRIELETVPLSERYLAARGDRRDDRLAACTAGDDYELLFAAAADDANSILALADEIGLPCSRIGRFEAGTGLVVTEAGESLTLPEKLGFEHQG